MGQLTELEGTHGAVDCEFFKNISEIRPILKKKMAATCADSNGAIIVWKDVNGFHRAKST